MANTLVTPQIVAREVLDRLYESTVLAQLVHRDFDGDFTGAAGDTVTIRRPAQFTAEEFTTAISVQNATEASTSVVLDKHLDVSFAITAKEQALSVDEVSSRFLAPAAEALAQKIDSLIAAFAADTAITATIGTNGTPSTDPKVLVDAGKLLNDAKVPQADRFAALTTTVAANYLKDSLFHAADVRGDTDGLKEASIGRKFGFDVFTSTNLPAGGESLIAHKTAIALVTRTLEAPMGVAAEQAEVLDFRGFGLRVVKEYDIAAKQDVISIDLLCGVKLLDPTRAVRLLG